MERPCDSCGRLYVAKRASSRFCGDTCRKRGQRSPGAATPAAPSNVVSSGEMGPVVAMTIAVLEDAGRLETMEGVKAVSTALRIDSPLTPAAAIASLQKAHQVSMEMALEGVTRAADPTDELMAQRVKRAAG